MWRTIIVMLCLLGVAASAAPAVVLWDNGPLITVPGGGAGGADISEVQSSLGETIYGYGVAVSSGSRVADDFTITDPGGWVIDNILLYGYQVGSSTSSTLTAINLRIWDGAPGDPGSSVIFGDAATNRLVNSVWSNIYRVLDTDQSGTQRPVMENTVQASVALGAGTYWLDWQIDGSLSSGPWAPPTSYHGLTHQAWANAREYQSSTWNPVQDGSGLDDMPFVIRGTGAGPVVPEPSSLALLGLGLVLALATLRHRR